ncbi:methyltransferase, FkbM family [Shimia gijangensis]|uniref:Methyltransferase, FkbM family n=1 Tax=Shimia gijangensis TaxID=1470563 RepID=A0A1M6HSN2_9RHOB|nr:FkbM family methyltransferase [Shimia gijangensis]SHJ25183.1 methyltransferase, FkbM family [Shimia gijangensis]
MSKSILNQTITKSDRLKQLKERERGYFDLEFIRAMPPEVRNQCIDLLDQSQSQVRQDLFALAQLNFKRNGFFLEFGATDGLAHNNSFLMECQFGWNGILSEPARGWHDALKSRRKCIIDTRCVWKLTGESIQFTEAPRGENSSISAFSNSKRKLRGQNYSVESVSLNDLLDQHNAPDILDYVSIDTEGSEFEILNAFDFKSRAFRVLNVEHNFAPQREDLFRLLTSHGYKRVLEPVSRFDDWYIRPDLLD